MVASQSNVACKSTNVRFLCSTEEFVCVCMCVFIFVTNCINVFVEDDSSRLYLYFMHDFKNHTCASNACYVYFTEPNSQTISKDELHNTNLKTCVTENVEVFKYLYLKISAAEVSTKHLKNAEACDFSMILNEMIKYSQIPPPN